MFKALWLQGTTTFKLFMCPLVFSTNRTLLVNAEYQNSHVWVPSPPSSIKNVTRSCFQGSCSTNKNQRQKTSVLEESMQPLSRQRDARLGQRKYRVWGLLPSEATPPIGQREASWSGIKAVPEVSSKTA